MENQNRFENSLGWAYSKHEIIGVKYFKAVNVSKKFKDGFVS